MTERTIRYDVFDRATVGRSPDGTPAFVPAPSSLLDQIAAVVRQDGDRDAVADQRRSLTYAELWTSATQIAGGLRAEGCRTGDRVCIDYPNSVEWVELLLGTLLAGCAAVPLDQRGTEQQKSFIQENAGARMTLSPGTAIPRGSARAREPEASEISLILYTSGTTGTPKGVVLSHGNLASYSRITNAYLGRREPDAAFRSLIAIPLCHSAGCNTQLLPTLALGGTAILAPGSGPRSILGMMEVWKPDLMFAVPVVYRRLIDATVHDTSALRSLRDVHYGAASAPRPLVEALRAALPWARLGNIFGMTEISNAALFLSDEHIENSIGSVGFPVPAVECEIRQADSSGVGELFLRGPNMALGYWQRPDLTADVFGSGWVRSGDMAEVGRDGAIYLHDRKDDVINRGGEKIFSTSVEEALLAVGGIRDAAVVGVPDDVLGERVAAVVVSTEEFDVSRIRTVLKGKVPGYALPDIIVTQAGPLPRGSSGKLLKRAVVEQYGWVRASSRLDGS